jgi:hypothetical protein
VAQKIEDGICFVRRPFLALPEDQTNSPNKSSLMCVRVCAHAQDDNAVTGLVSVDAHVGALHVGLAAQLCEWKPTPMMQWVSETVRWAVREDEDLLSNTDLGRLAKL